MAWKKNIKITEIQIKVDLDRQIQEQKNDFMISLAIAKTIKITAA